MFPHQLTNTLLIDFLSEKDAPALFNLIQINRAYLKEFLPWLDYNKSPIDSLNFIKKITIENNDKKALTLCLRDMGQIVGVICFHPFNRSNNSAGIGYWLGSDYQGKGIITHACHYLIDYGFNHLNLDQINISCNTLNTKSMAVPERLGFSQKRILPHNEWLYDHYVDHCCYEINAIEWASLKETQSFSVQRKC